MTRLLTTISLLAMTALMTAAGPEDGVREAGAGWRQGAIKQDKALLEKSCRRLDLHTRRRTNRDQGAVSPTSPRVRRTISR